MNHPATTRAAKDRSGFIAECCLAGIPPVFTTDDRGNEIVILTHGHITLQFTSIDAARAGLRQIQQEALHA